MVRDQFYIPLFMTVLLTLDAQSVDAQPIAGDGDYSPSDVVNDTPSGYGPWYDFEQPPEATTYHRPFLSHCDGWYAGVELVMVKSYWEDEVDTLTDLLNDPQEGGFVLDPSYNCSLSPRIHVGHRDCTGFGGRVRYWLYDQSANEAEATDPNIGETQTLNASLHVQALDAEATKRLSDGLFSLELGGGLRYGRTQVTATLEFEDTLQGTAGQASFEGVGPTIFAEARHHLNHTKHFSVVGNLRGSLLFGKSHFTSRDPFNDQVILINKGRDDLVPIIEAQFGLEYARDLGHGRLAMRALMEGQWWGIATPGASFSRDLAGAGDIQFDRFNTGRDVGFFGVTAAVIYDF